MTYEEFDKRCDELENAPLPERKTFFADVLAGETEKTDVRMMAFFRYALLFYREGDFRTAREILEPFIIDYKSYRYRPEIIACFNLVGVVAYYVQEYALSRFYIHEGLKIAREHSEVSRYAYEYNNLAVTYLAQQDYEKALEAIREAEKNLPVSDEVMHAYVYRNLTEICCHLDRLDEAKDALAKCVAYRGREILPEEVRIVNTLLTYKSGDTAGYKRCCAELRENLPQLHAEEFLASCKVLFDCGMDAGDNAQVEWVLDAMDAYLRRDPKEAQVGLRAETCRYEYAKATGNTALMLAALEKKETYYALVLARKEEVRVRDAGRYLRIGQRLQAASAGDAGAGLALGLIRTIDILHLGQCFGTSQSGLQFRRHGVLRFNGAGHFFFTLIQSAQVFQAVAQVAQHLVIHRAGSFFAVAGNKWDGVPGIDQVNGTLYVFQAQVQFLRQLFGMIRHLCSHFLFYKGFSTRDFPAFFEKKASAKKL